MFTGLIQAVGTIVKSASRTGSSKLLVHAPEISRRLKPGDSVAVSGVCLTAINISHGSFTADLAAETMSRTSLSRLSSGATVNLELPLKLGQPVGGHMVQGHVDGTGSVLRLSAANQGGDWILEISIPGSLTRYVASQGSIALEGISLTVAETIGSRVVVAIIPHTYKATNLNSLKIGDPVNIEVDIAAKYAEKLITDSAESPACTSISRLVAEGF